MLPMYSTVHNSLSKVTNLAFFKSDFKTLTSLTPLTFLEIKKFFGNEMVGKNLFFFGRKSFTLAKHCLSCMFNINLFWRESNLDVCQAYAESHGIIFNCNKTVCMTFKAKSARSTATPVLTLGGQYVNSFDQYKYLGIVLDTELSDDKDIQRQLRYQYCAANKLRYMAVLNATWLF